MSMTFSKKKMQTRMLLSPLSRHVKHVLVDSGLQAEPQNRARAIPHPVCLFIIIPPSRQGWTIHPRPDRGTRRRHREPVNATGDDDVPSCRRPTHTTKRCLVPTSTRT
jgi:hypothetical protein